MNRHALGHGNPQFRESADAGIAVPRSVIAGVLMMGIKSDLPGDVIATVTSLSMTWLRASSC